MKIGKIKFLLYGFLIWISCDPVPPGNKSNTALDPGFLPLDSTYLLAEKLLIGKKESLEGVQSLNIAGHRLYHLDRHGNITGTYDISNNYSIYTYDKEKRLVKSENKQHSPPETYNDVNYSYNENDEIIKITRTSYKDNEPTNQEIQTEGIKLDAGGLKQSYFQKKIGEGYFIHPKKREWITFEEEMVFCCGRIMEDDNKLTYYFNADERIDSLVIEGLTSKKRLHFEYEYETQSD